MIFIFFYLSLLILLIIYHDAKYTFAISFVLISPTFLTFSRKYLSKVDPTKLRLISQMDIHELFNQLKNLKNPRFMSIHLENNTILIKTKPSWWSIGEEIRIKEINNTYFVSSHFSYKLDFLLPDIMRIHAENVKKIKKIILSHEF
jgi:hypothetical protein